MTLTLQEAQEKFTYDPDTGTVRLKASGKVLCAIGSRGYMVLSHKGKLLKTHQVIWLLQTGAWPENDVDHINRQKTDNRWANLRATTRRQNLVNTGKRANNISGFKGVTTRGGSHSARLRTEQGVVYLGSFATKELAAAAYDVAAVKHNGEFAVTNKSLGLLHA